MAIFHKTSNLSILIACIFFVFLNNNVALGQKTQKSLKSRQDKNAVTKNGNVLLSSSSCQCMDYWDCVGRNGEIYSYCGISDGEVCCFMNEPVFSASSSSNEDLLSNPAGVTTEIEGLTSDASVTLFTGRSTETESIPTTPKLSDDQNLIKEDESMCGQPQITPILDSRAEFGEWPWHVAILEASEDLYICGGALVSPNRVITAAHCLSAYTKLTPQLKIRAGEYDVSGNFESEPHVEVLVDMIAIHPQFNNASLANDIAIVGLSRPINYTLNIQPLCLPIAALSRRRSRKILQQKKCVVTGWGRMSEDSNHSVVLKEVIAPLWTNADCQQRLQKTFGSNYKLPQTSLCAGDQVADTAICDGDGGGPLFCLENGKWYHEGIVSFGLSCGSKDSPGVYTRVSSYLNWIRSYL